MVMTNWIKCLETSQSHPWPGGTHIALTFIERVHVCVGKCTNKKKKKERGRKQGEVGGAAEALNGEIPLESDIYVPACAELTTAS